MMFEVDQRERFIVLTVGVFMCSVCGTAYAFGIFTNYFKESFGFGQEDITLIGTVGFVAGFFSFPIGVVYDYWGPRVVLIFTTVCVIVGFVGYALVFAAHLPQTVAMICVCNAFVNVGCVDVGCLMPNLFIFPLNRGGVVALQKTFMGLGSAVLVVAYEGFFHERYTGVCSYVAVEALIIGSLAAYFIQLPPYKHTGSEEANGKIDKEVTEGWRLAYTGTVATRWRFAVGFIILAIMTVFLFIVSFVSAYKKLSDGVKIAFAAITLAMSLCFVLMFALRNSPFGLFAKWLGPEMLAKDVKDDESASPAKSEPPVPQQQTYVQTPTLTVTGTNFKSDEPESREPVPSSTQPTSLEMPVNQIETPFLQNIPTVIFWVMWFQSLVVWGSGVTAVVNTAQIYRAVNNNVYERTMNSLFVATAGLGSAIGRILAGTLESFLTNRGVHVTCIYFVPPLLMAIGWALFFLPTDGLFLPFLITGISYGMGWGTVLLVIRFIYAHDPAKHYNVLFTGAMVGTVCINRLLFGGMYDKEAHNQGIYPHCSGSRCISTTIYILIALNAVATVLSVLVHVLWMRRQNTNKQQSSNC